MNYKATAVYFAIALFIAFIIIKMFLHYEFHDLPEIFGGIGIIIALIPLFFYVYFSKSKYSEFSYMLGMIVLFILMLSLVKEESTKFIYMKILNVILVICSCTCVANLIVYLNIDLSKIKALTMALSSVSFIIVLRKLSIDTFLQLLLFNSLTVCGILFISYLLYFAKPKQLLNKYNIRPEYRIYRK